MAGALGARWLAARLPLRGVLRAMMLLSSAVFFACATPVSFPWFFAWRFAAGLAGGVLMVLAAPAILPLVPPARRGLASGAIFTGVGLGIAASGTVMLPLLARGVGVAWIGLGGLALLLTALSWPGWPRAAAMPSPPGGGRIDTGGRALTLLILVYGLNAIGLVPHMVFLVDFVARGLGRGQPQGNAIWVAFGLGAVIGPAVVGALADRVGFRRAMRAGLAVQVVAVALPALTDAMPLLFVSAVIAGVTTPGVVPLALGRIHGLLPPGSLAARAAWSKATTAWAVGQASGAYALSFLFARTHSHAPLFAVGAVVLLLALALDLTLDRAGARRT